MQLGQVECAVLGDPRFCQSSILLRSFSRQIVGLLVEGFLVDLLLSPGFWSGRSSPRTSSLTGFPVSATLLKMVAMSLCRSVDAYLISSNSTLSWTRALSILPFLSSFGDLISCKSDNHFVW